MKRLISVAVARCSHKAKVLGSNPRLVTQSRGSVVEHSWLIIKHFWRTSRPRNAFVVQW